MFFYKEFNLTKARYSACIAIDVISSEISTNNQSITLSFLNDIAGVLNLKFKKHLVVPFQVRGGDELIGVLNSFAHGYQAFHEVWLFMIESRSPFKVRFGLGFGTYDTLGIINPLEINGSCVISAFRARDKFLKNEKSNPYPLTGPVQFYSYSNNLTIPYGSVNALIYSMYESLKTKKQQDLIWAIKRFPKYSYQEIAQILIIESGWEDLDISKNQRSNISKMLKRINYETFSQMEVDIFNLLYSIQILLDKEWEKLNE